MNLELTARGVITVLMLSVAIFVESLIKNVLKTELIDNYSGSE